MPPNADERIGLAGADVGIGGVAPVAAPHGFVCLITAAAGSSNSRTMRAAASRSSRLVNDSSLPCSDVGARRGRRGLVGVPGGRLVRVLAVPQIAHASAAPSVIDAGASRSRATGERRVPSRDRRERRRRSRCRTRRCARRPCAPARSGTPASVRRRRSSCLEHRGVVGRRHDHEHVAEVLGGRAHQARPADVDLLDQRVEGRRLGSAAAFTNG